ncbi:MAG: hypothetical protein EXQ85_00120 [Alphaproteobacteria bacterium]|nr:hypothetical protein [Alphaproteobacteria bacterium]
MGRAGFGAALTAVLVALTVIGDVAAQAARPATPPAAPRTATATTPSDRTAPIEITADALQVQQDRRLATFSGNVDARQADWQLQSDRLHVAYAPGGNAASPAISRIEAQGNVRLTSPSQSAQGDEAVYDLEKGTIVMTGVVVLTSGSSTVRGRQLQSNLSSGQSTLGGGRVDGVFLADRTKARPPAAASRPAPLANEPLRVAANYLEVQQNSQLATFSGSVEANQGDLRLRSNTLRVYYDDAAAAAAAQAVSRIDAVGQVFLSSPSETAQGDQGVYDVTKGTITLTGSVVLTRDNNVIRGQRLVMDLNSGTSLVDSAAAGGGRVRGLFTPDRARP